MNIVSELKMWVLDICSKLRCEKTIICNFIKIFIPCCVICNGLAFGDIGPEEFNFSGLTQESFRQGFLNVDSKFFFIFNLKG